MVDVATQGEDLGALALLGAGGGEPLGALEDDGVDVGVGLDVVEHAGLAPEPLDRRERRTRARLAAVALDRGHEGRLLAADEGAGAHADLEVEGKARADDVVAEQAVLAGLVDRVLQALDGQRVLGAYVDVALMGADRKGADRHALDHRVRVALEHGAVHEGARVALVGVAEDVLDVALLLLGEAPLEARRESGAAASAQARGQDLVDDLLGGHLGERLDEGCVAVAGHVVFDAQRVDQTRVAQHDLDLAVEELHVVHLGDRLLGAGSVAHEARYDAPLEQVLLDDLGDVGHLDVLVEDAVGVDERHRAHGTRAQATGLDDLDLVGQALLLQLLGERGTDGQGAGGDATAARADEDVASELLHIRFLDSSRAF